MASLTLEEDGDGEEEVDAEAEGNTTTLDGTKKEQEEEPSSNASRPSPAASASHLQALFTTQIIISGKTEPVRRATEQLQKILMPSAGRMARRVGAMMGMEMGILNTAMMLARRMT
eukprot:404665_1